VAESAADRQRRYRRHKANDHSLCVPGRCADVTPTVTRDGAVDQEERGVRLEAAGQQLWDAVTAETKLAPMQRVLLLEACRIADRLDRLDGQLRGGDWLRLEADEDRDEVIVVVDKALAEARQQATALKALVSELRQAGRSPTTKPAGEAAPEPAAKGAGGVADLSARIAARRSSPAG
jgi:hypothetical protein